MWPERKALLITEGIDPNTDAETLNEFDQLIIAKGLLSSDYHNLAMKIDDLGSKNASTEFTQGKINFARDFVEACRTATEQIGQDLKLAPAEVGADGQPEPIAAAIQETSIPESQAPVYDLRGVMCPMNYVKTKLKMEMMDHGEQLEVWLDAGDPIKNVPMSLRNDGHKILAEEALDTEQNHFKILVEKVEE